MSRPLSGPGSEPHLTPETIIAAPELAVLALLDESLRATAVVLLAAQPALIGEPPAWRVRPDLVAAARLLREASTARTRDRGLPPMRSADAARPRQIRSRRRRPVLT